MTWILNQTMTENSPHLMSYTIYVSHLRTRELGPRAKSGDRDFSIRAFLTSHFSPHSLSPSSPTLPTHQGKALPNTTLLSALWISRVRPSKSQISKCDADNKNYLIPIPLPPRPTLSPPPWESVNEPTNHTKPTNCLGTPFASESSLKP